MAGEGVLDLHGAHPVAFGFDDAVGPAQVVEEAVGVPGGQVAGVEVVPVPEAAVGLLIVQVAHHEALGMPAAVGHQDDLPLLPRGGEGAVLSEDFHVVLGQDLPHGALLPPHHLGGRGDEAGLGLGIALVEDVAGLLGDGLGQVGEELFPAHGVVGDGGEVIPVHPHLGKQAVDRRLGHDAGGLGLGQEGQHLLRGEAVVVVHQQGPLEEPLAVELGAGDHLPPGVPGGEVAGALVDVLHVPGPPVVGQGEGVVMEDPLGQPRGARGEVEQEGVGGQGGHPVQGVRLLGQGG